MCHLQFFHLRDDPQIIVDQDHAPYIEEYIHTHKRTSLTSAFVYFIFDGLRTKVVYLRIKNGKLSNRNKKLGIPISIHEIFLNFPIGLKHILKYIQVWGGGVNKLFSGLDHNLILSANSCTHGCIEAKPYLITVVLFT